MSSVEAKKVRATILRDTTQGEGLISIQGKQYSFNLQTHWRSDMPPNTGAKVDVWLDAEGKLTELRLVPESELAKELAAETSQKLQQASGRWFKLAQQKLGHIPLLAMAGLFVGWVMCSQVSFSVFGQSKAIDIWQILRMMHAGSSLEEGLGGSSGGSIGLWGYLFVISMVAPFSVLFTNARKAHLTLALPLALLLVSVARVGWGVYSTISEMKSRTNSFFGGDSGRIVQSIGSEMFNAVLQNMSFDFGFYLSLASALVLAFYGWLRFGINK